MEDRSINKLNDVIIDAINEYSGKWVYDYRVLDKSNHTYYLKISGDMNSQEENLESLHFFRHYLEEEGEEGKMLVINEMNTNLKKRQETPIQVLDIQIHDITLEEALSMTRHPHFSYLSLTFDSIEEEISEWDTGIHKLIVITYETYTNKRKRQEYYDYPIKMRRTKGGKGTQIKKGKKRVRKGKTIKIRKEY